MTIAIRKLLPGGGYEQSSITFNSKAKANEYLGTLKKDEGEDYELVELVEKGTAKTRLLENLQIAALAAPIVMCLVVVATFVHWW